LTCGDVPRNRRSAVALRDLGTGHEAQFTYDAQGLPLTLTDSWSGTSWQLTADTPYRRIWSIEVSGRPGSRLDLLV
jgi:YD repeat-containing protein